MMFYRIPIEEILPMADGSPHSINQMVIYVTPESLESYQEMFGQYRHRYILGEPELTEVDQDYETGEWVTEDTCFKLFCK